MAKCIIDYFKDQCSKKTSNYHHGNLKEELLQQSVEIINTEGIEALTLSVLSKKLGTSRSAIYRHFSSKNDLMEHVILYVFEILENKISPVFNLVEKDSLEKLYFMGKEYIQFAKEHPNLYRMLFGDKFQVIRQDNCSIENEEQATGFYSLVNLLIEGQEKGIFKTDDPIFQAQIIHAMVHGLASLYIDGHTHIKDNIEELYETSFKILTQGISSK
jgi:AcrR family transcriptional regulator